jgi:hypothetical protein
MSQSEALFIGGRAGVGKSSVSNEIHIQLFAARVRHCCIEGDNLDLAYPPPWEHHLAERNLAAIWRNYRELGYRRMVYTNTASVRVVDELTARATTRESPLCCSYAATPRRGNDSLSAR